jgi:phenylacetic acid degradation protein
MSATGAPPGSTVAHIYSIDGITPVVDPAAFVHPTAVLIGDVLVGPNCYVGPHASLRGDFGRVELRAGSNIQDSCTMHSFPGQDAIVEEDGHIGHGAILHGCVVGRNAMVGMNAVVMDGAEIGENSIVAAMAFVKANEKIPPRSMVVGAPGRIIREVTDQELIWKTEGTRVYQDLTRRCLQSLKPAEPLTAPEPNRRRLNPACIEPLYKLK